MSNSTVLPPGYALGSFFYYAPNKGAPIAFAILFAISGILHIYECIHYHAWKVAGLLPWAAVVFVGGFVMRAIAAWHYDNLSFYISSTVLLLCAPPIYEGANYFILGRILYYIPYHSPVHPGRVITTFGALQALVEAFNGNGASRVSNTALSASEQAIGKALIKAALILQLFSMLAFVTIAGTYHYRCRRAGLCSPKLRTVLIVLYTSCVLITARTIYRTIEWFEVADITLSNINTLPAVLKHEPYFWVFEVTLMYANTTMLNIWHPMRFLPRNIKIYLAEDGVTEIEGPGYEDKRPFIISLIDPFDVWGIITKRDKKNKYWEQGAVSQGHEMPLEVKASA